MVGLLDEPDLDAELNDVIDIFLLGGHSDEFDHDTGTKGLQRCESLRHLVPRAASPHIVSEPL